MSIRGSVVLAGSGAQYIQNFVGVGSSAIYQWPIGGRTALVFQASAFGTIALGMIGPSGGGIPITSSLVSNQVFTFDSPGGNYYLTNSASSSIAVYATLSAVPYNL